MAAIGVDWAWKALALRPRAGACLGDKCIVGGYGVDGGPVAYWLPKGEATGPSDCTGIIGVAAWQGTFWAVGWRENGPVSQGGGTYLDLCLWKWTGTDWQYQATLWEYAADSGDPTSPVHPAWAEACRYLEMPDGSLLIFSLLGAWLYDGLTARVVDWASLPYSSDVWAVAGDAVASARRTWIRWRGRWWRPDLSGSYSVADTVGVGRPGTNLYDAKFVWRRYEQGSGYYASSEALGAASGKRMAWWRVDYYTQGDLHTGEAVHLTDMSLADVRSGVLAVDGPVAVGAASGYWAQAVWAGGAADGTIWVAAYKLSEMSHPWEEPAQCWIGCWPGWGHLLVDALEVEYSDGSRAHEPSMDTLALEYSADTRPQVPVLDVVELEYSDGSGSHTPVMDRLAIEYSDGTGGGQPILDLVGVEYAAEAWGSEPALDEAAVEYAMSRPAPPGQGEAALVLEPISSDEPIVAVRVVLAELSEAERGQCRCLVRADSEDLAVDNWESYEEFEPERNYYLEHPGRTVRVAVIGPASAPAPDVFVQTEV